LLFCTVQDLSINHNQLILFSRILVCFQFGSVECCESHASKIYTAIIAFAIACSLDVIDMYALVFWLSEQHDSDVCYPWSADANRLEIFVLSAQSANGFHAFFGCTSLALFGWCGRRSRCGLSLMDSVHALIRVARRELF
jgi:hypothetical protein